MTPISWPSTQISLSYFFGQSPQWFLVVTIRRGLTSVLIVSQYIQFIFKAFCFEIPKWIREEMLYAVLKMLKKSRLGPCPISVNLSGHLGMQMPLTGQLWVTWWFWRPWPLAQRIPGFLYMIDIPSWCYIEITRLRILCYLVTVQITGMQTPASFSVVHLSARLTCLKIEDVILSHYGVTQLYERQNFSSYKISPWQISLYSPRCLHSPMKC